jgi:hypothetical protein
MHVQSKDSGPASYEDSFGISFRAIFWTTLVLVLVRHKIMRSIKPVATRSCDAICLTKHGSSSIIIPQVNLVIVVFRLVLEGRTLFKLSNNYWLWLFVYYMNGTMFVTIVTILCQVICYCSRVG